MSRREDDFGYGAQALVVQGRPPADGVGQVFGFIGGGGETARTLARCDQAHGLAPWSFVENEGEQKGVAERAANHDMMTAGARSPVLTKNEGLVLLIGLEQRRQAQVRPPSIWNARIQLHVIKALQPCSLGNRTRALALTSTSSRGLAVAHLAISVILVWLAINIAFVVLRLRATPPQHRGSTRQAPIEPYNPAPASLHHRMSR